MKRLFLIFCGFFFAACSARDVAERFCLQVSPNTYILNFEYNSALMNAEAEREVAALARSLPSGRHIELYGNIAYAGVPQNQLDLAFARLQTAAGVLMKAGVKSRQIYLNMQPEVQRIGLDAPVSIKDERHQIFMEIK